MLTPNLVECLSFLSSQGRERNFFSLENEIQKRLGHFFSIRPPYIILPVLSDASTHLTSPRTFRDELFFSEKISFALDESIVSFYVRSHSTDFCLLKHSCFQSLVDSQQRACFSFGKMFSLHHVNDRGLFLCHVFLDMEDEKYIDEVINELIVWGERNKHRVDLRIRKTTLFCTAALNISCLFFDI